MQPVVYKIFEEMFCFLSNVTLHMASGIWSSANVGLFCFKKLLWSCLCFRWQYQCEMLSHGLKILFVVFHIVIFEYLSNVTKTASKNGIEKVVCKKPNKTRPRQPLVSKQTAPVQAHAIGWAAVAGDSEQCFKSSINPVSNDAHNSIKYKWFTCSWLCILILHTK